MEHQEALHSLCLKRMPSMNSIQLSADKDRARSHTHAQISLSARRLTNADVSISTLVNMSSLISALLPTKETVIREQFVIVEVRILMGARIPRFLLGSSSCVWELANFWLAWLGPAIVRGTSTLCSQRGPMREFGFPIRV
jgi:hypothetical protein